MSSFYLTFKKIVEKINEEELRIEASAQKVGKFIQSSGDQIMNIKLKGKDRS